MKFRSDNAVGAAPEVMQAIIDANHPITHGYGADEHCQRAEAMMREVLNAPHAKVYFVSTGTAANALALSTMVKPYEAIFCHALAHIEVDEAGAPEFYTNGAKLHHVAAENGLIDPKSLQSAIHETGAIGVHNWQRGAVSITNLTEQGALYACADILEISQVAKNFKMPLHLDGARFANSVAASGNTPAEMSHEAGVDVLVFGGTKNGAMGVEAVVFFDDERAWDFEMRRKRGGHLSSKGTFLGAQFEALLTNDLWLNLAKNANDKMSALHQTLSKHAHVHFDTTPDGNMAYLQFPREIHRRLLDDGAEYYLEPATQSLDGADDEPLRCRLVTSWATTDEDVAEFTQYFV